MITARIDPPSLALIPGSSHIVVAEGQRLVFISGQIGVARLRQPEALFEVDAIAAG